MNENETMAQAIVSNNTCAHLYTKYTTGPDPEPLAPVTMKASVAMEK